MSDVAWWLLVGVAGWLVVSVVSALVLGRVIALRDGRRPLDDLSDDELLALVRALDGDRR